jgi:hypothetical protein
MQSLRLNRWQRAAKSLVLMLSSHRKHRSAVIICADLLLLFAALPYAADLRIELENLRAGDVPPKLVAITPIVQEPTAVIEDASLNNSIPEEAIDPFIAETRRRAEKDPEAAMRWIQSQAIGPERLLGMLEVVALWAAKDSPNALLWLESNAQGLARLETINSGIELWGQQDPAAAAEWIDGMANDGSKVIAIKALAANWVTTDPDSATRWLSGTPKGIARNQAASAMVDSWTSFDPAAATTWALEESKSNRNYPLLAQSIRSYVAADPKQAENFLRTVSGAADTPHSVEAYVEAFTQYDPEEAAAWLGALSADDLLYRPEHARILIEEWSQTDSVAASAWLREKAEGPERDAAISGFAQTMITFEPGVVAAWANTVSEPKARLKLLDQSITEWAKTDPISALEWVKTADIEPVLRDALANEIGAD